MFVAATNSSGLTRRAARTHSDVSSLDGRQVNDDVYVKARRNKAAFVAPLTIVTVLLTLGRILFKARYNHQNALPAIPRNAVWIDEDRQIGLAMTWRRQKGSSITHVNMDGPHHATLYVNKHNCKDPKFLLRMVGPEAIVSIPIQSSPQYRHRLWEGTFAIPFPGNYTLEPHWYGCDDDDQIPPRHNVQHTILVAGTRPITNTKPLERTTVSHSTGSFKEGFWADPSRYKNAMPNHRFWKSPDMGEDSPTNLLTLSTDSLGESVIAKEAHDWDSQYFGELSNYELVCWLGGTSAERSWTAFKSLRPLLAKNQKPFKFHYYKATSFSNPDESWDDGLKLRFRKCKIVLVSLDEVDTASESTMTQEDYKTQVAKLLHHLVRAFDDSTFPIWMMTVNHSPSFLVHEKHQDTDDRITPIRCASPKFRSNNHPCNDALFELFEQQPRAFNNEKVKLLDNSDLTNPLFLSHQDYAKDVYPVIAMRIASLIGQQVKTWREAGQRGKKEGLERKGILEPNVDFEIYKFD